MPNESVALKVTTYLPMKYRFFGFRAMLPSVFSSTCWYSPARLYVNDVVAVAETGSPGTPLKKVLVSSSEKTQSVSFSQEARSPVQSVAQSGAS